MHNNVTNFQFAFTRDPLKEVRPWGEPGSESLHWFGLTQGEYWIDTHAGEVMRYTDAFAGVWDTRHHPDYFVARLFEDVQENFAAILEPVPRDIAKWATSESWLTRLNAWLLNELPDEGTELEQAVKGMSWFERRDIRNYHLTAGPVIRTWRVDDVVHVRWVTEQNHHEGVPIWESPTGEVEVSAREFELAAVEFCQNVLGSMASRVRHIVEHGWPGADCELDVHHLVKDQHQREEKCLQALGQRTQTDWDEVRRELEVLRRMVGWSSDAGQPDGATDVAILRHPDRHAAGVGGVTGSSGTTPSEVTTSVRRPKIVRAPSGTTAIRATPVEVS